MVRSVTPRKMFTIKKVFLLKVGYEICLSVTLLTLLGSKSPYSTELLKYSSINKYEQYYINFPPLRRRFLAEPPGNCGLGACSGLGVNAGEGVGHTCLGVNAGEGVGQDCTLNAISLYRVVKSLK